MFYQWYINTYINVIKISIIFAITNPQESHTYLLPEEPFIHCGVTKGMIWYTTISPSSPLPHSAEILRVFQSSHSVPHARLCFHDHTLMALAAQGCSACPAGWVPVPFPASAQQCVVQGAWQCLGHARGYLQPSSVISQHTVTPCPQHPAPCPVPASQTHQGCPGPLAAEQEAALPSCAVILSHPTARAQGGAALPHVLDTWTPPVPGRAHSPVFAVSGGLSCTSAHVPWFLVELIKCHQYWTHETVSVSQCSGDECLEATVPP